MSLQKQTFVEIFNNLSKIIDVDDGRGRSVPQNMNFIEEGYLSKDTGCEYFGDTSATDTHSIFRYEKKDGTKYTIRAKGTKLQVYNTGTGVFDDLAPTFTAGARFGFVVYNDDLYGCNGVEDYFKWDGTTFTTYASAPKGNSLEIFEDRMFVTGVTSEPLNVYYTDAGTVTVFPAPNVLKPLGTDYMKAMVNYYGTMLLFKRDSIWKLTFVYDQVVSLFLPKLEVQSKNYGVASRKSVVWVENDLWFFTGREIRSIGYQDQQIGILGVNQSVISEPIKESLYTVAVSNYDLACVFYYDRRFYVSVPIGGGVTTNNTTFVCHTLYENNWTKYVNRIKSSNQDYMEIDGVVYTASSVAPYGLMKWDTTLLNDNNVAIASEVFFDRVEDKDFNKFTFYRYLDLMFKDLTARVTVTIRTDANDSRFESSKAFVIGSTPVSGDMTVGEIPFGDMVWGEGYGYTIEYSPFQKRRISFLEKGQAITIGISNSNLSETFTLVQMALSGHRKPRKMFKPSSIVSI
jgi:hypothetical protein